MVIEDDTPTQLEIGTRTPDLPQAKLCPELWVPQSTKGAPQMQPLMCRGIPVPWVVLGLVASQLSTVKNGVVWVNKRVLTFGRFPVGELKSKNKIKAT